GNLGMPRGTSWVKLTEQVGAHAEGTPAAVLARNGDRLDVQFDDDTKEKSTVDRAKTAAVESRQIREKTFHINAVRRLVPKTEEINVHLYNLPMDAASHAEAGAGPHGTAESPREVEHEHQHYDL